MRRTAYAPEEWCEIDKCPASVCGGPHVSHRCLNGDLVIRRHDCADPCPFCEVT